MATYHVVVIIETPDGNDEENEVEQAILVGPSCRTHVADREPHGLEAMIGWLRRQLEGPRVPS